jgi:glycosyltransferase involved in cell wall biosynthesis
MRTAGASQGRAPVSAVIPCYRCSGTIRRAVESVAAQTLLPREVILVDDCSADGTVESLRRLASEYPDGWVKVLPLQANGGPGQARNAGWDASAQPYVAFLDADDSWHDRKIEIQFGWMQANPDALLSGHASVRLMPGQAAAPLANEFEARPVERLRLLLSNCFSTRSVMLRRDLPIRFHPSKRYMEDYWWLLQIVFSGREIFDLGAPLAFTFKADFGEGGLSARLWEMEKSELDNYWGLWRSGMLGIPAVVLLSFWSLLKYVRRCVVSALAR